MVTVPKTFELGGRTWEVRFVDCVDNDPEILGCCDDSDAIISLRNNLKPSTTQAVFYHELVHAIFGTLGWEKLNEKEGKVDALSGAFYQYLQSKQD